MSQIPQSKLQKIQKEYVEQLDEFLNITMSDVQVKQWTLALAKFDDDVLRAGWTEFLYKVRPGLMPSIEDALKILNAKDLEYQGYTHNRIKNTPPASESHNQEFGTFMKAMNHSMKMKMTGEWNEGERLQYMIDTYKKLDMKSDANDMQIELDRWNRENIDETKSPI